MCIIFVMHSQTLVSWTRITGGTPLVVYNKQDHQWVNDEGKR